MDEQIQGYPAGIEVPSALYWRGRIYEEQEHNFGQAVNYYRALTASYTNYYYAVLARQRLNVLKGQTAAAAPAAVLSSVQKPVVPPLTGELPENEPHLIKARLLANAALNEYIGPEIQASPTASQWGALGQAEIYSSYRRDDAGAAVDEAERDIVSLRCRWTRCRRCIGSCCFRSRTGAIWWRIRRRMGWILTWWRR